MQDYILNKVKNLDIQGEPRVEIPPYDEMGDYSIQCASLHSKEYSNPHAIAEFIKENFDDEQKLFFEIKVMGPYVNFYLNYDVLAQDIIKQIEQNKNYGSQNQGQNEELLIEHTSINPNAEPHIGRCRNSLVGDFMSNLYQFAGYKVERHYFINDLGKKIALLLIGIEKYGLQDDSFSSILDVYVKISDDAKNDEKIEEKAFDYLELVENGNQEMIDRFKDITDKCVAGQMKIFDKLNIHFDIFTHESNYVYNSYLQDILNKIKEKGKLKEDELGRYYVDLSDYNIPTKQPVLVLTRSNKTSLYPIKDIAYTIDKMKRNSKNNYIVLGEDQEVYMQQISAVMDILGYSAPKLISYSYVLLDGDKMSTSGGKVVLISDFMNAVKETLKKEFALRNTEIDEDKLQVICNACIKFTMLNVSKKKIVNFNLENATSFTGESGMYILYSLVRINSLLKANPIKMEEKIKFEKQIEHKIIKELSLFPKLINDELSLCEPSLLTHYIFNLAQLFSKLYEQVNISKEKDPVLKSSRIRLLKCLKQVLENALKILGIESIDFL